MVKGNSAIRPMTETMEVIHGIRNITPGAIATTAMLVSVFFVIYLCRLFMSVGNLVFFGG